MDDEKKIEILLAEYNSLRGESMEALRNKFQVLAFGFAGLSVFVGSTLTGKTGLATAALILFVIVPTLSKAVMVVWLGEHRRMVRAGGGVAALETEINRLAGASLLGWERWVRTESRAMSLPYRTTIGLFQFASGSSVLIGGLTILRSLEARDGRPGAYAALGGAFVLLVAAEITINVAITRRWRSAVGVADVAEERLALIRREPPGTLAPPPGP